MAGTTTTCTIFIISLILILISLSLGLIVFWVIMYGGNFQWDDYRRHTKLSQYPAKFNFHPPLMVFGFIFMGGLSLLSYRLFACRMIFAKLVHTILHCIALSSIAFGVLMAYESKEHTYPITSPHFYSLHSWIGLGAVALYAWQFLSGFSTYIILLCCEKSTAGFRTNYAQTHSTLGIVTIMMATGAILVGLTQLAFHSLKDADPTETKYNLREPESIVINLIGCTSIVGVGLLVWLVRGTNNRAVDPEERI